MNLNVRATDVHRYVNTYYNLDTKEFTRFVIDPTDEAIEFFEQIVRRLKALRRVQKEEERVR